MLGQLIGPEIKEMIAERQFAELRRALLAMSPDSVAEILSDLSPDEIGLLFRILPKQVAADIFEYLPVDVQETLLRSLQQEQVAAVLNEMAPDDRTALLEDLPESVTERMLSLMSADERRIASQLLAYPPDSVGRRMTTDFVAVPENWSVNQVLAHLRRVAREKETLDRIYVVDQDGRLVDDLGLRELILADPDAMLSLLEDRQVDALRADQDQEEALRIFERLDLSVLPVVDAEGILVGIVTADDVIDVAESEATEDIHKMAAVETLDAPYLRTPFFTMVRKRAFWLSLLFVGEMLTATAMGYFEAEISQAVVLALFIPLIISSGGNSGSQAASLVIRSLALREVRTRDWWRVLRREVGSGLALGAVLGSIALAGIMFWPWRVEAYGPHYAMVAVTVAVSLVGVVLYGTLMGAMMPIMLRLFGFDPAISSAPFVATLVDVSGIVIYFSIAAVILRGTLL